MLLKPARVFQGASGFYGVLLVFSGFYLENDSSFIPVYIPGLVTLIIIMALTQRGSHAALLPEVACISA